MKIEKSQNTSFQSNLSQKRFITKNMKAGIQSLLIKMNQGTVVEENGDYYISTIMTKLKHDNGAVFEDERRFDKILPYDKQMKGFSVLKFGKTRLDIDNENGEIIDYKKPLFKPWFLVFKKAEKVINDFRNNFYDDTCINIETLRLRKLTPDGSRKMRKFVLEFEKERLQKLVEELEKD